MRSKKQANADFARNGLYAAELAANILKSRAKIAGDDGTLHVSVPNKTGKQGMTGEFLFISRMKNDNERTVTLTELFQSARHLKAKLTEPSDTSSDDSGAPDANSGEPKDADQERIISEETTEESRPTDVTQMPPMNNHDTDDVDNGVPEHAQTPESDDDNSDSPATPSPEEPPDLSTNVFYSHWSNKRRPQAVINEERQPMDDRKRSVGAEKKTGRIH